jgi:ribose 5-phosphate isomerase B
MLNKNYMNKTIYIANDHAGVELKEAVVKHLEENDYTVINLGTNTLDSVDYPDFAHPLAKAIEEGKAQFGILICGSANGVCITANKHQNVRAALCWKNEIASLARQHNDANVLGLPARFITIEEGIEMVHTFLNTEFEGGRHQGRVDKISC